MTTRSLKFCLVISGRRAKSSSIRWIIPPVASILTGYGSHHRGKVGVLVSFWPKYYGQRPGRQLQPIGLAVNKPKRAISSM